MSYITDVKYYHKFKGNALKIDIKGREVNTSLY